MSSVAQQRCRNCGTVAYGDEVQAVFQTCNSGKYTSPKTICNLCLITARTEAKEVNRFLIKARSTIKHHVKSLARWVTSQSELTDRFLWKAEDIAREMEKAWADTCAECGDAFSEMPNGLHDLTLDINDPEKPPYYGLNTRFVCTTCNRAKSKTPMELWGARKAYTIRWRKRQEELARLPKWQQCRLWNDDDAEDKSNN